MSKQKPFSNTHRPRRTYTPELRADAVRLVLHEQRTIASVARALEVSPKTLSAWVRQTKVDQGHGPEGALTSDEKDELRRLRRENRQLRMEREILKKATAFFVKELP